MLIVPDCVALVECCAALSAVVLACFAPFVSLDDPWRDVAAIAGRLFPFGRGLVHDYWAPNAWALYIVVDKAAKAACCAVAGRLTWAQGCADLCAGAGVS